MSMGSIQTSAGGVPVVILREGTKENRGKEAQRNNLTAAKLVAEVVKSSLGPRGMDKMLVDTLGDVTITNDGATILKEIDVQHPAAKMMVEITKSVDNEVGDGTTSVIVLAGSLLEKAKELISKNVHPTNKDYLKKIASTSISSKLTTNNSPELSQLVVNAMLSILENPNSKENI